MFNTFNEDFPELFSKLLFARLIQRMDNDSFTCIFKAADEEKYDKNERERGEREKERWGALLVGRE